MVIRLNVSPVLLSIDLRRPRCQGGLLALVRLSAAAARPCLDKARFRPYDAAIEQHPALAPSFFAPVRLSV